MRINLMIEGQEGVSWEQWLALAQAAEDAGLEGLFRSDHYRSILNDNPTGSLDAWTVLAGLAARTERLRLGTMVSPVTFRPASVLAKSVVTVDHISNGRVELGIGAGGSRPSTRRTASTSRRRASGSTSSTASSR
jgi:alkanesulfonate monooxygenase SsuD/methylene tetrahydromethanopterin reductase-like flavin-dependent oxidoreductase (luciferase family)